MQLAPNDFRNTFEYGNFLYSISENTEAERFYTEALEVEPKNVLALTFIALNKLILNQIEAAYEYILKALEVEPNLIVCSIFVQEGFLFAKHEYEDAKRYLIRAIEQKSGYRNTKYISSYLFRAW